MPVKFATGWSARLNSSMSTTATVLPVPMAAHASFVSAVGASEAEGHTFLVLSNGTATEVVRAYAQGQSIRVERGATPIVVPEGACVTFEVTQNLLDGYMVPENTVTEITAGPGISVSVEDGVVTIGLAECDGASWTVGNVTYRLVYGCVTAETVTPGQGCVLAPGVYKNATVTVNSAGQICSIVAGANIVFSDDPCCADCGQ